MNEMKMNDYEMSVSNRARLMPGISVQRKPSRVQTMEEMKKMSLELFFSRRARERAESGELEIC